ncbi:hypothetical protein [Herpetosiphon gulosus]|uniref:Uncharacterized protein n=1 Tax=Herpetosiphon gulosus TaxID=1973496 RepID=A0ABP9WVG4_9CHLR
MIGTEPLYIEQLKVEAERLQRRFEQATDVDEFIRVSQEASRRIAVLAPIASIIQRYMLISELAHREYEAHKPQASEA